MGCTQSQATKGAGQTKAKNKTKELKTDKSTKVQAPPASTETKKGNDPVEKQENQAPALIEADILVEDKSPASEDKAKKNVEIPDLTTAPEAEKNSPDSESKVNDEKDESSECTTAAIERNTVTPNVSEKNQPSTSTIPEDEGEVTGESKDGDVDTGVAANACVELNNKDGMNTNKYSENDTEVVFKSVKKTGSYFRKMFSSPSKDCPKGKEKLKETTSTESNEGPSNSASQESQIAAASKDDSSNENDVCDPACVDRTKVNEQAVDTIPSEKEVNEADVDQIPSVKDDTSIEAEMPTQIEQTEHESKEAILVDGTGSVKNIISLFSQGDSCNSLQKETNTKYKTAPALTELGRSPSVAERQKAIMRSYKEATSNSITKSLQDRRIQSMKEETGQRRSSAEMKSYWHTVEEINEVVVTRKAF